mgnify:CR=1 FL=1
MKCPKCEADNEEGAKFCEECGSKLEEHKKTEYKAKLNLLKSKKVLMSIVILMVTIIFVFTVPLPYTAKEGYTEKVPYEAQESYTEKEPYTERECPLTRLDYNAIREDVVEGGLCITNKLWDNNKCNIATNIKITNTDSESGSFKLICYYSDGSTSSVGSTILGGNNYIQSGEGKEIPCSKEYNLGETLYLTKYEIEAPLKANPECKIVTLYKDVTKTRTITKYRDEYKEKSVTKYATLWQKLTGQVEYYSKV